MNPSKANVESTAEGIAPMAGALGTSPAVPFIPPRDTPGQVPLADNPTPPAMFHVYGFTVQLYSQAPPKQGWTYTPPGGTAVTVPPSPTGQSTGQPLGSTVFVVASNLQAAQTAIQAQFGADLAVLRGGTPAFVGAYLANPPGVNPATGFLNVTPGAPLIGEVALHTESTGHAQAHPEHTEHSPSRGARLR